MYHYLKNSNMEENLIRISTYAKREDISVVAVYKRIKTGQLTCVEIDGVKFVKLNKNEEN